MYTQKEDVMIVSNNGNFFLADCPFLPFLSSYISQELSTPFSRRKKEFLHCNICGTRYSCGHAENLRRKI